MCSSDRFAVIYKQTRAWLPCAEGLYTSCPATLFDAYLSEKFRGSCRDERGVAAECSLLYYRGQESERCKTEFRPVTLPLPTLNPGEYRTWKSPPSATLAIATIVIVVIIIAVAIAIDGWSATNETLGVKVTRFIAAEAAIFSYSAKGPGSNLEDDRRRPIELRDDRIKTERLNVWDTSAFSIRRRTGRAPGHDFAGLSLGASTDFHQGNFAP